MYNHYYQCYLKEINKKITPHYQLDTNKLKYIILKNSFVLKKQPNIALEMA